MKNIIGVLLVIAGVALGAYVGFWIMFVGGIMGIANAWDIGTLSASLIGWNVIKILSASFVGYGIFSVLAFIGGILIED
ncbi:MAG: hypothetical protein ACRCVJ_18400 [Clostridium sp.]|uniref:hypothetical protein n=1 Tax=Clostridium sp. TaxID=1506 RepID=UPI003F3B7D71